MPNGKNNCQSAVPRVSLVIFLPPFALSHFLRAENTVTMSPPLHSQQRDPRLQSTVNGISYNQKDPVMSPSDDSVGSNQNGTITIDDDSDDLQTPRPLDLDAPVRLNGTHNASIGAHNAQQRNPNSRAVNSNTTACRSDPKAKKSASTSILKILPALKAQMEAYLGKKIQKPSRDQMLHETNRIIGNRNSIVKSAINLDRQLAAHSESGPLPPSSESYQVRLQQAIPTKKLASKTNRQAVATDMVRIFQVLYEVMQEGKFELPRAVKVELETFMHITEETMHICQTEISRSKQPSEKLAKGVQLPKKKMERKYLEEGGKKFTNSGGSTSTDRVECCPRCSFKYFDKEPDYDDNKRENQAITDRWADLKERVEQYENGELTDPPVDSKGKEITSVGQITNPSMLPLLLRCHIS